MKGSKQTFRHYSEALPSPPHSFPSYSCMFLSDVRSLMVLQYGIVMLILRMGL